MRTRELAETAPRSADHSEDLAVEGNFEDAPWVGRLADEQYLIRAGSDANRVWRSAYPLEAFAAVNTTALLGSDGLILPV
jgi:hypothetical protein